MQPKLILTFDEVIKLVDKLVRQINQTRIKFDYIYGIPRGGLVLAIMLSYKLDIPIIAEKKFEKKHILVVDDIADSGQTFKSITKNGEVKNLTTTALVCKIESEFKPDFIAKFVKEQWVVFPWETEKSSKKDNTKI